MMMMKNDDDDYNDDDDVQMLQIVNNDRYRELHQKTATLQRCTCDMT